MKKLSLNLAGSIQSLTREQMKKINGGYGPTCGNSCNQPDLGGCQNGTDGCVNCGVELGYICYDAWGSGGPWCTPTNCGNYCPPGSC